MAQNVITLALAFIYRLKKLNSSVKGKPGSEYRLLTVALMLANKFLDDHTYTNKTWAEVSGITVAEVHIMEVEFLSNMKYSLFISAEEWDKWQIQLGCFADFFELASRVPASRVPTSHAPNSQVSELDVSLLSSPTTSPHQASTPHSNDQTLMHYQPLGRPQEQQTGPLPYIPESEWWADDYQEFSSSNPLFG